MLGKLLATIATALVIAAVALIVAAPSRSTSATAPLEAEEQAFLTLINNYRQQNGQTALTVDTKLQDASEWMSQDMGINNYFSHTDSLGRDPFVRMSAFGYNYNTWKGENLAAGTSSAQTAFDLWRNSPGHNSNMLGSNYVAIGIARVYTAGSQYGWYWTTDFGGFLSSPLPPQSSGTPSPTPAPTATPTPTATATPTLTPTATPTPAPTSTPTSAPAPTATSTHVPTATPTPAPTATPTSTATSAPSPTPTATSTPAATATPTPAPTATPTPAEAPPLAKGDVDCSGTITSADALVELRGVAQLNIAPHTLCSDDTSFLEDADCNDHVTAVDALKILRYVALLPVSQSEPCPDIGMPGS